MLKERR